MVKCELKIYEIMVLVHLLNYYFMCSILKLRSVSHGMHMLCVASTPYPYANVVALFTVNSSLITGAKD